MVGSRVSSFSCSYKLSLYLVMRVLFYLVKYLQISKEKEEYSIKVPKELRASLVKCLTPGCWVKVTGMRKYELHKGKVKYKAYRVELLNKKRSLKVDEPGKTLHLRIIFLYLWCKRYLCYDPGEFIVRFCDMRLNPVNPVSFFMVTVEAEFVRHIEDEKKCTGDSQGHPQDI